MLRRSNSGGVSTQRVMKKPSTLRGKHTQRIVLKAAEEVFARRGLHRSSVAQIAERAGVATGTFYVYFEGKEQLFLALVEDLGLRLEAYVTEQARARLESGAASRRRVVLEAFLDFVREHPHLYRLVRQSEDLEVEAPRAFYRRIATTWSRVLSDDMSQGDAAKTNPELLAWILMGVLHFVGMRYVEWQGEKGPLPDTLIDQVSAFIEAGVRRGAVPNAAPGAIEDDEPSGYTFFE